MCLRRHRGWGRYGEAGFENGLLRLEGAVTDKVEKLVCMQSWQTWGIDRHGLGGFSPAKKCQEQILNSMFLYGGGPKWGRADICCLSDEWGFHRGGLEAGETALCFLAERRL